MLFIEFLDDAVSDVRARTWRATDFNTDFGDTRLRKTDILSLVRDMFMRTPACHQMRTKYTAFFHHVGR
jgi:hypothetical protein